MIDVPSIALIFAWDLIYFHKTQRRNIWLFDILPNQNIKDSLMLLSSSFGFNKGI